MTQPAQPTAETLVPPDIEAAVVATLTGLADSVATRVPNPRPADETYIRVTRTGGAARNLTTTDATVLVECWAPDSVAAFTLAQAAYGRLWATYRGAGQWGACASLNDPVNFPDPDTDSPRYQFLATLIVALERHPTTTP